MSNFDVLKTEVTTDPLGRGYSAMSNEAVATDLNTVYREEDVDLVRGQDIFEAVVPAEYNALTDKQMALLHAIIGMGDIQVNGTNTRDALLAMFGAGTETRSNLAELQKQGISRGQELGLGIVKPGHVEEVRR